MTLTDAVFPIKYTRATHVRERQLGKWNCGMRNELTYGHELKLRFMN